MLFSSFPARAGLVLALAAAVLGLDGWLRPAAPAGAGPDACHCLSGQMVQAASLQRVAMGDVPMPPGTQAITDCP